MSNGIAQFNLPTDSGNVHTITYSVDAGTRFIDLGGMKGGVGLNIFMHL